MGLPTKHRIKRTRDFSAVREAGKSNASRCLILAVRPRPEFSTPHAGFTTTKRIGNAVTRNKVRRRLRMIVREFFPQLTGTQDLITIAKYPAVKASFAELREEWQRLARKAGLFLPGTPCPVSAPPMDGP
jgi:ribonuclease P protein component